MTMNANELRKEIEDLERKLTVKKEALVNAERTCRHQWSDPQPDHIHRPAYTSPGDPPGTMGVDWRGPVHVPAETVNRWKRVCSICGKTEHTTKTTQEVKHRPSFG